MLYILQLVLIYLLMTYGSGYVFPNREDSKDPKTFPYYALETKTADHRKRDDNLNTVNDYRGIPRYGLDSPFRDVFIEDEGYEFQDHRKKSDSRPKYDPGWKFIGLGKRPGRNEDLRYVPDYDSSKDSINPFLGISTLINFEFFNAIRDGIEDAERETVKKEHWSGSSSGISGADSGSLRYNNKLNWNTGQQRSMYDPGWMLTGLGKRTV